MNTTTTLGLKKPETNEYYNIDDFNDNADILEANSVTVQEQFTQVNTDITALSLHSDVTYYVATTGDDDTGDGSESSPFATIQHAFDILPKDLNGYKATISVAAGTYSEDLLITGFNNNGLLGLTLTGDVTIGGLTIDGTNIICNGTSTCILTILYLLVIDSGRFDSFSNVSIAITGYITDYPLTGNKSSIAASRGDIYISGSVTLTGNTDVAISTISLSRIYFYNVSGTGFDVGIFVSTGSMISYNTNNISATTAIQQSDGGMAINSNGTQISDLISSGLSCTWGTISGGYRRIGTLNGVAQVIISLKVTLTSDLTAGTQYSISGFPVPIDINNQPCGIDDIYRGKSCYLVSSTLYFIPSISLSSESVINFSCTYITN